ncbi:FAD-dependent oxidoreductase [Umezawaea sp. NPDC059074]|uniref:FAD-dependent oxidoreductase n=1 Tax=Umezawaea sp. NPDC059074 TaxID=3346716 RepID=UPI0036CB3023
MREVDVLVVGAGTVGLASALFLARQGVRALVVERHPGPARHPRAFAVNGRSAELFREVGVEGRLAELSAALAHNQGVLSAPTLAQVDQATVTSRGDAADLRSEAGRISPATLGPCPQDLIDPVLLSEARAHGASVEFGSRVHALRQDESGVVVEVTGEPGEIRARYVVAADGSSSTVRRLLGIPSTGPGELGGHMVNVLFRADLSTVVGDLRFALCTIDNPRSAGILMPVDNVDRWIFHIPYAASDGVTPADFTHDRCRELVSAAIGSSEVEVEILGALPWQSTARVATRFRDGRVLLVGDAAHVVPPTGGFGLNTGLADAHNLAWKLAAVLDGQAGPALLDTYEAERQPVAHSTMDQALLRGRHRELHWDLRPERAADRAAVGMTALLVTTFGYQYRSTAVVDPRPDLPSAEHVDQDLDGSPGSRVPHVWLRHQGDQVSTVDLAAGTFTVLAGPEAGEWCAAAKAVSARTGILVRAFRLAPDGDASDEHTTWPTAAGVGPHGALLVRPDGFVAWRATTTDPDPERTLEEVMNQILDRAALAVPA